MIKPSADPAPPADPSKSPAGQTAGFLILIKILGSNARIISQTMPRQTDDIDAIKVIGIADISLRDEGALVVVSYQISAGYVTVEMTIEEARNMVGLPQRNMLH